MRAYDSLTSLLPFLYQQGVAQIIWAAEGIKPVSSLDFRKRIPAEKFPSFVELLESLDLRVMHTDNWSPECVRMARNEEDLFVFVHASTDKSIEARRMISIRHGKAYGYPISAVEGFAADTSLHEHLTLPKVLSGKNLHLFQQLFPFRLSRKYWRDEVLIANEWFRTLSRVAPEFYQYVLTSPLETGAH